MEVTCPKCSSRFNLPDAAARPGVKLRCSVCKTVFVHEGSAPASVAGKLPPMPLKKKFPLVKVLAILAVLLTLAGGGWWWYTRPSDGPNLPVGNAPIPKNVELLTMRNVRQYYVDNEKMGKVFVIEGRVVNEFPEPKELVAVEAAIYGKDRKALAAKTQLCGAQLSLFQLQVLSDKEMEAFLNNKIEILTNNTNVPHGGEVPFMVLFYAPPEGVAEFGVRIVDARDVAPEKGK